MELTYRPTTFGRMISFKRKERHLTQSQLITSNRHLQQLSIRLLNEIEQDRLSPLEIPHSDIFFTGLCEALELDPDELQLLASDFERAHLLQQDAENKVEMEAVAFRARTVRG